MAKHNKKRNVGLLHEQLIRHASRMTVEGNVEKARSAVDSFVPRWCHGTTRALVPRQKAPDRNPPCREYRGGHFNRSDRQEVLTGRGEPATWM